MSQWVRLWEDMPNDPKWRVVSLRSGRPLCEVISVFIFMLTNASASSDRGSLESWDDETVAVALGMEEASVRAIREAMQGKVLNGERLTGWEKRQPKREDNSSGRVQALRNREKEAKRAVTHCNAQAETETQCDAPETETETDLREAKASLVSGGAADAEAIELERFKSAKRSALADVGGWWNGLADSLGMPQIEVIKSGSAREKQAWARCREWLDDHENLNGMLDLLAARIRGSPWLRGEKGFGLTFDWVMNATNYQKIVEGNYEDRQAQRR